MRQLLNIDVLGRYRTLLLLFLALILSIFLLANPTPADPVAALHAGDYQQAAKLLQQQLDDGNTLVSNTLGGLYYLGLGVEQDFAAAASLFSRAAFAGNIAAQTNLGHQYYHGLGLTQDIQLAFAWFNLAHDKGGPIAGIYMAEIISEQKLSPQLAHQLRARYASLKNFPAVNP